MKVKLKHFFELNILDEYTRPNVIISQIEDTCCLRHELNDFGKLTVETIEKIIPDNSCSHSQRFRTLTWKQKNKQNIITKMLYEQYCKIRRVDRFPTCVWQCTKSVNPIKTYVSRFESANCLTKRTTMWLFSYRNNKQVRRRTSILHIQF